MEFITFFVKQEEEKFVSMKFLKGGLSGSSTTGFEMG